MWFFGTHLWQMFVLFSTKPCQTKAHRNDKSQQKIIKSSNKQNKPSFTGLLCGTCRKAPMKTGCSCGFTTIHPSANHHDVSSLTGWMHNHNQKFVDKNHPPRVLQPIKKSSKKKIQVPPRHPLKGQFSDL